ncbi:MAG: hypothetical protein RSB74_00275 [Kiritimatiellia bacterium]
MNGGSVSTLVRTVACVTFFSLSPVLSGEKSPAPENVLPAVRSYAIVASQAVMKDSAWKAATVTALQKKYPQAQLYVFEKRPEEVKAALAQQMPQYTAFVVRPEEAGVQFTITVSNFCRALDNDPYVDTLWSVITGYDPESAQKLAEAGPIAIRRALDCSGMDLTAFAEAWRYTEDHRGTMNHWKRGAMSEPASLPCDTDNTQGVLERLQKDRIQFLATSGHATQHNWDMGYSGPNLWMEHKEGRLVARDTKKQVFPVTQTEPKVYFANGNCLIGDIDRQDCMALSWMRDGAVRQMMGYTVTTWFGAQGWGALGLFVDGSGLYSANEAFHFTNSSIVESLVKTSQELALPELLTARLGKIRQVNYPMTAGLQKWSEQHKGEPGTDERLKQTVGQLHDRDVVCFYGDPALDARIAEGRYALQPWTQNEAGLSLKIRVLQDVPAKPLWVQLPGSWTYDSVEPKPEFAIDNLLRFPAAARTRGDVIAIRVLGARRKGQ